MLNQYTPLESISSHTLLCSEVQHRERNQSIRPAHSKIETRVRCINYRSQLTHFRFHMYKVQPTFNMFIIRILSGLLWFEMGKFVVTK